MSSSRPSLIRRTLMLGIPLIGAHGLLALERLVEPLPDTGQCSHESTLASASEGADGASGASDSRFETV